MNEQRRKKFAVILFVAVLAFITGEVLILMTAKQHHDISRAKRDAEDISIELGLISSSLKSGNRSLYERSAARFDESLASFAANDHVRAKYYDLSQELQNYRGLLKANESNVGELLELSAALRSLQNDIERTDTEKLDAANFYHIQQAYQALRDSLTRIESENFNEAKQQLDDYAKEIVELAGSAATCVSVCPKESFAEKIKKLDDITSKYKENSATLGDNLSKTYDPSQLIVSLRNV